ncbi:hypothetical protein [Proteiniphilum sp.]|uniref:hypothetical protein n=1 Tax=Proteiniphilum sp. TaxID=1926877 RepID=UPI002B1FED9D|nr:hypothetical protein [Proteiniphilum sp.]MEA4919207.1 hypothetical protein [Proteiniphilum sp.]
MKRLRINKKNLLEWLIALLLSFFALYMQSKSIEIAFWMTISVTGMFFFNFAVCIYYRDLKANRFKFKDAATPKSWMYFGFFVGGSIIAFLVFLPKIFWVYAGIMSGCLWVVLFIYDLIKNGLR